VMSCCRNCWQRRADKDLRAAGRNWAALVRPEEHRGAGRQVWEKVPWRRTSSVAAVAANDAAGAVSCNAEECDPADADLRHSWSRPDPMVEEDLYYPDP